MATATGLVWEQEDHVLGLIYGQCVGDTIGLLTEFMKRPEAKEEYGQHKELEFEHKIKDMHRARWKVGDWTDDSDQMVLIMQSLVTTKGTIDVMDFAQRVRNWHYFGFKELGDYVGMGIGELTMKVVTHKKHPEDPIFAAEDVWIKGGCTAASNGGVMRTAVLGTHQYQNIDTVIDNAVKVCKVTHADPRCIASCVAVSCAVAFMFQRQPQHLQSNRDFNIEALIKAAYKLAKVHLQGPNYKKHKTEMKQHMFAGRLSALKLDGNGIGYTYKTLGAGFWALRQTDFRTALQKIVMEGGDADTNCAVAGALLGCRVGAKNLPPSWRDSLLHKQWLEDKINLFLELLRNSAQTEASGESVSQSQGESVSQSQGESVSQSQEG